MSSKDPVLERKQRRDERINKVRAMVAVPRVRVVPKNDVIRKNIKHPSGIGFLAEGSIEWPLDQFTKRRIRDGDVTIEEARKSAPSKPSPHAA